MTTQLFMKLSIPLPHAGSHMLALIVSYHMVSPLSSGKVYSAHVYRGREGESFLAQSKVLTIWGKYGYFEMLFGVFRFAVQLTKTVE